MSGAVVQRDGFARFGMMLVGLTALVLTGCEPVGEAVQTWWGPLDSEEGGTPFSSGGQFTVQGLGHRMITNTTPARDLLGVVLIGASEPVSCSAYARYLDRVSELEDYIDTILEAPVADQPPVQDWYQYVCQQLDGAAVEAFGGDGSFRAVQLLMDVSDGGPTSGVFRPSPPGAIVPEFAGGDLLGASNYVVRIYERSRHGSGILPDGGEGGWRNQDVNPITGCPGIVNVLVGEREEGREDYPDASSLALSAATHRYYHHYTSQQEIQLEAGEPLQIAVTMPEWDTMSGTGADLSTTLFGDVSRVPETFPYTQLLLSTQGRTVRIEPCTELTGTIGMLWPEVTELSGVAPGDDDDSAPGDDDDDSAIGDDDDSGL